MPAGIVTLWLGVAEADARCRTAGLPAPASPASASAAVGRGVVPQQVRMAVRMFSAIAFISAALAVLPRIVYASAAAFAPEYQNAVSVRSCEIALV